MSFYIKSEVDWIKKHATYGKDKTWRCNKTNEPIMEMSIGRSIHIDRGVGFGEVRTVKHLHCPKCELEKKFPEMGKPILESELVEASDTVEA